MAKREYTAYQQQVIRNYYAQLDTILLGRLQELVTELYLAGAGKRADRLWQRAGEVMAKLKVPKAIREHILASRDIEILAKNVSEWLRVAEKT